MASGYSVYVQSESPPGADRSDSERRRLERLLPELIKRVLESGYEKLAEGPENVRQMARELKLPKEALALILTQLDESKNGVYRAVAREIRDFLDHTNLAEELAKALTTLSFEIKTEVRFIPNDSRLGAAPDVRSKVRVKRQGDDSDRPGRRGSQPPPEPAAADAPADRPSWRSPLSDDDGPPTPRPDEA